jgi:CheY-like chemotaxis protein
MLGAFDWVEVVGEAADGESALRGINELRPELAFLDVQMPGLLGTDVLSRPTTTTLFCFALLAATPNRCRHVANSRCHILLEIAFPESQDHPALCF